MNATSLSAHWRIALLAAASLVVATGAPVELRQTSVPTGILNTTTQPEAEAIVTTQTAPETSGNFRFVEWTLNGVRLSDASGGAANPCTFTINVQTDAVAIYLPATEDADADGLPDWWERRYFGSLQHGSPASPDSDAFPNSDESVRNQHPALYNLHEQGGISRRRSQIMPVIQDWNTFGLLREISIPAGAVARERVVAKGMPILLSTPPPAMGGHHFTGWLKNGVRFDRPLDFQPISIVPALDVEVFTARYIADSEDFDSDGVPDWREWLLFESLQYDYGSDPDGDGFTWAEEEDRGYSTLAANQLDSGGLSRRRSQMFYVDTTGKLPFRQTSAPATILEQTDYYPEGTIVTVPDKTNHTFANYRFSWWDLDGVRRQDPSGVALGGFQFPLQTAATALANYFDPNLDTDDDGIKDWHEWTYYGDLSNDSGSDTDGDGFTYAQELTRNQSPRVANTLESGGISRRRSQMFYVDTTGKLPLRLTSTPATILEQTTYHDDGTVVSLPEKSGHTYSNYRFSWWTLNGQRLEDPSGVAVSTYPFDLTVASTGVANYIDPNIDADADGIKDWHEWTYYAGLEYGPENDTDADGFTYTDELIRNQSPRVNDTLAHGGISRRRGQLFVIDPVVAPTAPEVGSLFATNIGPHSATLRALVNPMSAATTANFSYGETPAHGFTVVSTSILNGFSSQPMDATLGDLQANTTYHFTVHAMNDFGTTTSQNVTFTTLPDYYPGYAGWNASWQVGGGTQDFDNDGLANLVEYAFGLNPRNPADAVDLPAPDLIPPGRWRFRYTRPASVTGVIFGAEWSTDLTNWTPCVDIGINLYHEFWTPADAGADGKLYGRWKIISP